METNMGLSTDHCGLDTEKMTLETQKLYNETKTTTEALWTLNKNKDLTTLEKIFIAYGYGKIITVQQMMDNPIEVINGTIELLQYKKKED
jgi:hypothetical protein